MVLNAAERWSSLSLVEELPERGLYDEDDIGVRVVNVSQSLMACFPSERALSRMQLSMLVVLPSCVLLRYVVRCLVSASTVCGFFGVTGEAAASAGEWASGAS